jgi:hypothetical protein
MAFAHADERARYHGREPAVVPVVIPVGRSVERMPMGVVHGMSIQSQEVEVGWSTVVTGRDALETSRAIMSAPTTMDNAAKDAHILGD